MFPDIGHRTSDRQATGRGPPAGRIPHTLPYFFDQKPTKLIILACTQQEQSSYGIRNSKFNSDHRSQYRSIIKHNNR